MGRNKIAFTGLATQEVGGNGVTELDSSLGLLAEQNHVGELAIFFAAERSFTVDTA
jgi:hypothetical protein